jgi:hypothetical protein
MFRLLVAGGRTFYDYRFIEEVLTEWLSEQDMNVEEIVLVHGDAQGVDRIAGQWAKYNSIAIDVFPAEWTRLGKRAGHVRNSQMIQSGVDYAILFPGGNGTANMRMQLSSTDIVFLDLVEPLVDNRDDIVYTK